MHTAEELEAEALRDLDKHPTAKMVLKWDASAAFHAGELAAEEQRAHHRKLGWEERLRYLTGHMRFNDLSIEQKGALETVLPVEADVRAGFDKTADFTRKAALSDRIAKLMRARLDADFAVKIKHDGMNPPAKKPPGKQ